MKIFEEIHIQLAQEKPFVCYAKPNENTWNLLLQNNNEIIQFSGQSGFVLLPFHEGIKAVIPFAESSFTTGTIETNKVTSDTIPNLKPQGKAVFEKLVADGIAAINTNSFDKVVLSRKMIITEQIAIVETFKNVLCAYPSAFRYLFFHPKIGLWMGATPEQLVKINQDQFETVALAGTQLFVENTTWATKEKEEQQFVTDYIVSNLEQNVANLKVSEPQTVQAGKLAHIKSIITGSLTTTFTAIDLVNTLHPTPAVCGFPKEKARDFILANENYDRKYYAGFLGEYNKDKQTDLFVNLRCLEIDNDVVTIYVGCGITKDSNPEKEYIETENKSMTMRNVLVSKTF